MGAGFDEQKLSLRQLCVLSEAGNLRPLGAIDLRPPKHGESGRLREGGRVDDWRGGGRRSVTAQLQARLQERLDERALHVVADEIVDQGIRFEAHPRVLRRMNRIIEEGRESVSALRVPDHDDNLESALARDAEHFKGERRIDVRLTVKGNPRPLAPLARDAVYQISREALANTFRHTRAKHVEVDVEYSRDDLTVRVRDDGRGIAPPIVDEERPGHRAVGHARKGRADRRGPSALEPRGRPAPRSRSTCPRRRRSPTPRPKAAPAGGALANPVIP